MITLVCGFVALAALTASYFNGGNAGRTFGVLAGLVAAVTAIYDIVQIYGAEAELFGEQVQVASPGWGVWVVAISAIGLMITLVARSTRYRSVFDRQDGP